MFRRACLIASAAALLVAATLVRTAPQAEAQAQNYQPIRTLYDFTAADAGNPTAGLIMDKAGNLYGTESGGNGAVFELSPPPAGASYKAWKKKTLYSFKGGNDGYNPWVSLFLDASGNLYGATRFGGVSAALT